MMAIGEVLIVDKAPETPTRNYGSISITFDFSGVLENDLCCGVQGFTINLPHRCRPLRGRNSHGKTTALLDLDTSNVNDGYPFGQMIESEPTAEETAMFNQFTTPEGNIDIQKLRRMSNVDAITPLFLELRAFRGISLEEARQSASGTVIPFTVELFSAFMELKELAGWINTLSNNRN